ncbi:MAG: cyclophilin-like fold protein [Chloroflexi bacterium]|nr:cyclophilin-like fold protein [Chloroflexota bacterium]
MGDYSVQARLHDTPAADAVWQALPLNVRASVWGDEIYAGIGVGVDLPDDATDVAAVGDLAIWPPGRAICIFFGPTPASRGSEPRAASPIAPVGRIDDPDDSALRRVRSGAMLVIEAMDELQA